ncbi:MAG: nitrate reductase molybdenum cofactor assembly chaperone [Deltaproteobacteria bacterium]|nr:nitrate reductase molybdenum cofactor assembly chaperone [Deltaproteobacteria bacterium]
MNMPAADKRRILKLFSVLLSYPNEALVESLGDLREELATFSEHPAMLSCESFLITLETPPLITLQEHYTAVFDFNPKTCLNLTYHEYGESSGRGPALAHLIQLYKSEGYETSNDESPDYLPMVLEFLSVCPDQICSVILKRHTKHISAVAERLKERQSPYGNILEALSIICRELAHTGD